MKKKDAQKLKINKKINETESFHDSRPLGRFLAVSRYCSYLHLACPINKHSIERAGGRYSVTQPLENVGDNSN